MQVRWVWLNIGNKNRSGLLTIIDFISLFILYMSPSYSKSTVVVLQIDLGVDLGVSYNYIILYSLLNCTQNAGSNISEF